MICKSIDELSIKLLENDISIFKTERFTRHINKCPACKAKFEEIKEMYHPGINTVSISYSSVIDNVFRKVDINRYKKRHILTFIRELAVATVFIVIISMIIAMSGKFDHNVSKQPTALSQGIATASTDDVEGQNTKLTKEMLAEISTKRMNDAWQDIKQSFNIDETAYLKVGMQDLNKLYQNELDIKFAEGESSEYSDIIHDYLSTMKGGDLKPFILIKRDKSEVLLLTKDTDGNNIMRRSTKINDVWKKEEMTVKGQPIYNVDLSQK